jgi:membrane protein insertase Oxa1/YidC/SpoIIIJ
MMLPPKSALPKPETKSEASLEDSMAMAQQQMVYLFPVLTGILALTFPSGLSIYWTVGNVFSIIQQFYVNRKLPHPIPEAVVETPTLKEVGVKKKKKAKKK